jgi:hypothetical protein
MKKIGFYLVGLVVVATAVTLVGCVKSDCYNVYSWSLKNGTESDLAVEYTSYESDRLSWSKTVTPGETVEIYYIAGLTGCGGNAVEYSLPPEAMIMDFGTFTINGKVMSESIGKLKYWVYYQSDDGLSVSYTLTVTDDLLNDPELTQER